MQEKHLFEYATIRVVPCVEREEFMNVGVIIYCPSQGFLHTLYALDEQRLKAFSNKLDVEELEKRLQAFVHICAGKEQGGTIGKMPPASRFRWLTATRSTIVQTSPVHPGLCADPKAQLQRLQEQLVLS